MINEMVKTVNLVYEYPSEEETEGAAALKGINALIKKGEFVAVIGHNGSGKSTLAKHVNALLLPTEGVVFVDGIDTRQEDALFTIRKTAGMVFQNPDNQIVASIVEEDAAFGPENLGVPSEEIRKRVDFAVSAVGMSDYIQSPTQFLSGGQKQRVAIAGILAMKPSCIVLDEPTAMLDPAGRRGVIETVKKLNREENITVILITHYMDEAVNADRVVVMSMGEIVMDGTPKEVFSRVSEIKRLGLDVPQVTEIAFRLKERGFNFPDGILTVDEMIKAVAEVKNAVNS